MIGVDIIREMIVDTDQKYQEKVEGAANMLFQIKQRYHINKVHDEVAIIVVEEFFHVSRYPLLESMGFDTDISDVVTKIREATLLGDIFRLHQLTNNPLKYVNKNSKYGHIVVISDSDTPDFFQGLQETKSGLTKFFSICQEERRKIRWSWRNTCQSICLINMKMNQFLPLINVGFLSALP